MHTEEAKAKISNKHLGRTFSEESKKKMSESRKKFFHTEEGLALRKKLSKYTALQHSKNLLSKSKRKGLFKSIKNNKLIPYHSSYEMRLCWLLEKDPLVLSYEAQLFYQIEDRSRCLDFLINYNDYQLAVEVKPTRRMTEQVNIEQVNDSKKNAEMNGWQFKLYTEEDLGLKNSEAITKWADDLKASLGEENYKEYRKWKRRLIAIKHYQKIIAQDKVAVWCDYCEVEHTPLRKTYEKNIAKNTTYVCEAKGGSIGGSKPKTKLIKENPYASDGRKECTACHEIKIFDDFGLDKSRLDGYASRCKLCRNGKAKINYVEKNQ